LFIHITLETAPTEMQCDETISHMVIAGQSYFHTLRNACVAACKIYHGCFEMLSWPHRTSNSTINICFWLLKTCMLESCTKCSYLEGKHATWCSKVGIWSEVQVYRALVHEYIVGRRSVVGQVSRQPALDVLTMNPKESFCSQESGSLI